MKSSEFWWKWGWRVGPVGIVVGWDVVRQLLNKRLFAINIAWKIVLGYGLLVAGWVFGWMMPDLLVSPVEGKYLPKDVREGMEASLKNALTVLVLMVTGIWVVSSSGSVLASGLVFGLTTRLFTVALRTKDYRKWYWVVAREISLLEHRIFMIVWAGVLLAQMWFLVRG
jgi:hypothetical protein